MSPDEGQVEEERPDRARGLASSDAPRPEARAARGHLSGRAWSTLVVGVVLAALLAIFIGQNAGEVEVRLLGAHVRVALWLALLVAALLGAGIALVIGSWRLVHLRRERRRGRRR
jgi:uncharacterized integral membrane protein